MPMADPGLPTVFNFTIGKQPTPQAESAVHVISFGINAKPAGRLASRPSPF